MKKPISISAKSRLQNRKWFYRATFVLPLAAAAMSTHAFAAGTLAGTDIENVATASYDTLSGPVTIESNKVVIKVDELLNVVVSNTDPGNVVTAPGQTGNIQTYHITNSGNGSEAFKLTADVAKGGDDFDPTLNQIIIDNGNGVYDPGIDTVYVAGVNDPILAPDETRTIFVITNTPSTPVDGNKADIGLKATAVTGSGAPGTSFAGAGTGGSDAVVGATGATGEDTGRLIVQATTVTLVKSATIVDPLGGSNPIPGAIITYKLVATVAGTGTMNNLVISDPIPAGTAYKTSSMTLEAAALTDAADTDSGNFNGSKISVAPGAVAAGQSRTVTFKVTIQ